VARSSYVYVVMGQPGDYELLGAFTVKHELLTCAKLCNWPDNVRVYRMPDGPHKISRADKCWTPIPLKDFKNG
jgi:hypothetical protein